jgi:hypothetical protein
MVVFLDLVPLILKDTYNKAMLLPDITTNLVQWHLHPMAIHTPILVLARYHLLVRMALILVNITLLSSIRRPLHNNNTNNYNYNNKLLHHLISDLNEHSRPIYLNHLPCLNTLILPLQAMRQHICTLHKLNMSIQQLRRDPRRHNKSQQLKLF